MTLNELVETVRNRVKAGGTLDSTQFHFEQVKNVLAKYRSSFIKKHRLNELDFAIKEYTETVKTDGTTGRKYIDLPIQIEELPRVGKGVISISSTSGYDFRFYPTTEREMKLTDALEGNFSYTDKFGYIVRFDRVDFDPYFGGISTIRISAIPTLDEYSGTDEVPLGDFEKEVIEGAVNFLMGTPTPDLQNN